MRRGGLVFAAGAGVGGCRTRGDLVGRRLKGRESAFLLMTVGGSRQVGGETAVLPGSCLAIERQPFPLVVDGHHTAVFQPHFGCRPAGLVGGGDEGQVAAGFVAFFQNHGSDDLVGVVIGFGSGQGVVVEDGGQVVHSGLDCSHAPDIVPLVDFCFVPQFIAETR